jgi:centromere/kinetochore protein ZW10
MSQDYQNSLRISGATERCSLDASGATGKKTVQSKLDSIGSSGSGSSFNHLESKGEVENGCFKVPDYRITSCAHDIVELTYQTLLEACSSGSSCATLLFQTSRDILFMFRMVISTLYEDQIRNDARTCMLFHNDCMYISLHILTLGHQFRSR